MMLHPGSHVFCSPDQVSSRPVPVPRWLGAAGERTGFACAVIRPPARRPSAALG